MTTKVYVLLIVLLVVLIIGGGVYGYLKISQKPIEEIAKPVKEKIEEIAKPVQVLAQKFATYEETLVEISPAVKPYTVNEDLANITNKDDFTFSDSAKNLLIQNSFVVVPSGNKEYFSIYEDNRYNFVPSFVTTDSMLHNYHLFFDYLLRTVEKDKLIPELKTLNANMLKISQEQYQKLSGTAWENAGKRNVAFFAVASRLLESGTPIPEVVKNEAEKELKLIEKHGGMIPSWVMNMGQDLSAVPELPLATEETLKLYKEDYTQYIPRGHYTRSEDLKKYFKTMMWYGRMTFRLKEEDETKSAVLATLALQQSKDGYDSWEKIYQPTAFFVGKADDISFFDYYEVAKSVYGEDVDLQTVTQEDKFSTFIKEAKKLPSPSINSMPIFDARFQPDREKEIKGFRFMGQRFTIDASVFQRLVYREVGDKEHTCEDDPETWNPDESRRFPKGLDIPASFDSDEAYSIIDGYKDTDYACYKENMSKMKDHISGLGTDIWTQNLYWGWLYSLVPLTGEKGEGYPSFMQNQAYVRKELNTFLGSWTELKRDTILYAKQVYAELGGGAPPEEKDDRGYVEPNPYVYARLASLIKVTKEGLKIRGLLKDEVAGSLDKLETLARRLKEISEKELNGEALTDEDYELIRTYGGSLEHFWLETFKDLGITSTSQLSEEPAPIVADVATDPGTLQVLEESTGNVSEIYAVVPVEGKLRIAKGGVYSYYEFTWPMDQRLTDEVWREILDKGEEPNSPDWTTSFIGESLY